MLPRHRTLALLTSELNFIIYTYRWGIINIHLYIYTHSYNLLGIIHIYNVYFIDGTTIHA